MPGTNSAKLVTSLSLHRLRASKTHSFSVHAASTNFFLSVNYIGTAGSVDD